MGVWVCACVYVYVCVGGGGESVSFNFSYAPCVSNFEIEADDTSLLVKALNTYSKT